MEASVARQLVQLVQVGEFAARNRAVVVADQDHHDRHQRGGDHRHLLGGIGTISDSRRFLSAELRTPTTATSTPGQRPAMVVTRTMAGMKKMNVTRDCVIGKISQCSNAAAAATNAAKANRRGAVFSIHGHSRASRNPWRSARSGGLPSAFFWTQDYSRKCPEFRLLRRPAAAAPRVAEGTRRSRPIPAPARSRWWRRAGRARCRRAPHCAR